MAWSHGYGNGNICQLQSADIFQNIPTGQKWTLTLNGGATVGDPAASELVNEESGDIVDNWIRNNFDIYDYEDSIQQMIEVDDDHIIRVVKDLSFTVSVD